MNFPIAVTLLAQLVKMLRALYGPDVVKTYTGQPDGSVTLNDAANSPLRAVRRKFEPDAVPFAWGESAKGSRGSTRLALSLIYDATGSDGKALMYALAFAVEELSKLPPKWSFSADWVQQWVQRRLDIEASVQEQMKETLVRSS